MSVTNIDKYKKKKEGKIVGSKSDMEMSITIMTKCMNDLEQFQHVDRMYSLRMILEINIDRLKDSILDKEDK